MGSTVRIPSTTNQIIEEIVHKKSKVDLIEEALKSYCFHERKRLLHNEYEKLRSDKKAWVDELKERKELEGTLLDGLEKY